MWVCARGPDHFGYVHLCDLWTVARQAPLSMGFFRQKYWIGLPYPPSGGLPDPGMEPRSPVSPTVQADLFLPLRHWESHGKRVDTSKDVNMYVHCI